MRLSHTLAHSLGLIAALAMIPTSANAFCGFYVGGAETSLHNDATMVVMMREGTRTVLSMQNSYQGPPERFAMVVPVPVVLQQDDVRTLSNEIFSRVDRLAAPRLVEYWEQDPCFVPRPRPPMRRSRSARPMAAMAGAPSGGARLGVRVEAQFEVGEYDIVILSAEDSGGLDTWLRQEGYHIPAGAEPALRPYVESGTKFFVARVDPTRVTFQGGRALLSPLRVHYDSDTFSLPVRLGLINSSGTQDLVVHVLARNQRYELANYPNAFIPTNVSVRNRVRGNFGRFYAALFDKTLEVNPGAVVTEYSWQSGSCDPCPGPTLTGSDIMTLGGDVVGGGSLAASGPPGGMASPGRRRPARRPGRWRGGGGNQYTLTRLHYRYGRGGLASDLVFRAAPPVVGGRGMPDRRGRMERSVTPSSVNNFQGRYAILHRWRGAISCEHPVRGRWGGPPNGRAPAPTPAVDLATQPRGGVPLDRYLLQHVPELEPRGGRRRGGGRGTEPDATSPISFQGTLQGPSDPTSTTTAPGPTTATATLAGCGVGRPSRPDRAGPAGGAAALVFGLLGLGLWVRRRKR